MQEAGRIRLRIRQATVRSVEQQTGMRDLPWQTIEGLKGPFESVIIEEEKEKRKARFPGKGKDKRKGKGGGPKNTPL